MSLSIGSSDSAFGWMRTECRRAASTWSDRLLAEHWRIGLIDAPLGTLVERVVLPPIRWLTAPELGGYWADPFGLAADPVHVYAERFDERSGLGRIERLALRGDALVSLGPIEVRDRTGGLVPLGAGGHTSFPHIFELDGDAWGIAETGAVRECVLYRIDEGGRWHSPRTLLRDVRAADPAIFRWQGRFWLAFTDAARGFHDNLCLFHAERLAGPWRPHARLPVKTDRGGARMAGRFFEHDGCLYRPGQDCRGAYGRAVVVHRVDACTVERYEETPVCVFRPDANGPVPDGLHTLTAWGDRTLVDGKRRVFNPLALRRKLSARWSRTMPRPPA